MAMQNLNEQIYDKAGILASDNFGVTDEMLDDIATHAYRIIINRVKTYNPIKLDLFANETEVTDSVGKTYTELTSDCVTFCERERGDVRYPCKSVPYGMFQRMKNPHSINFVTKYDPIYTHKNGTVFIHPNPSTNEKGYIHHVKFAQIVTNAVTNVNATSGITFPQELDEAIILKCIVDVKIRIMNKLMTLAQDEFGAITGTAIQASEAFVAQTSFTFTHNVGQMPGIVILDTNGKEMGGELDHNTSTFNSVDVTFAIAKSGTIYATLASAAGGDLANFESALPTWTAVEFGADAIPTLPAFPTGFEYDTAAFAAHLLTLPNINDFVDLTVSTGDITSTLEDIDTTRIYNALNQASEFLNVSNVDGSANNQAIDALAKITSHDVALSNETIKAANAYTNSAAQEIAAQNVRNSNWSKEVDARVGHFLSALKEWTEALKQYLDYDTLELTKWRNNVDSVIAIYSAKLQNEVQEFQSKLAKARSYLESAAIRLQVGVAYTAQMGALPNEIVLLSAQFENEVRMFCGLQPQTQTERR